MRKTIAMKFIDVHSLLKTIGENLHTIRNARKETLQSVALDIGVSHSVISKIENGRYKSLQISVLVALCNHYNVTLQQILSLEVANIFQLTQHNKEGNQKLIGQEIATGYDLYIKQIDSENKFLRAQLERLTKRKDA